MRVKIIITSYISAMLFAILAVAVDSGFLMALSVVAGIVEIVTIVIDIWGD